MPRQGEITLTWNDEDGDEISHVFPAVNEVCEECEGFGYVLCEGLRNHAFSREEFEETFDDPEDREAYFTRGGKYDQQCPVCHGSKVVLVVDEEHLSDEQKTLYASYQQHDAQRARWDAEDKATYRMESGGYY